ncbi:MAG: hypothetical protein ABEI74_01790 [Candidatus Pacearchaeota archaeon]
MLNDLLKEVVTYVAGKNAEEIVPLIHSKKHVNEFTIANKMDLTINQTRNILYKISTYNLVSSTREKDEKKGWYTYFWKLDVLKSLNFLKGLVQKRTDRIESQINNRENNNFYTCERCGIELNEEQALMDDFICNECGNVLTLKDNSKVLRGLRKNLTKFKNKISEIDEEIDKEKANIQKEKEKEQGTTKKAAKKKTTKKATTKKSTSKKSTAKKSSTKKATTKKATTKKSTSKKTAKKKSTTKKTTTKKSTAKKATKKAGSKKSAAKKSSTKKATTKKTTAKKPTTKKAASRESPTKKATTKKATTKKSTSKKKTTKKTGK